MRFPKALAAALPLALVAVLLVGVGSASAKRLTFCTVNQTLCKGENLAGEGIAAEGEAIFSFSGAGTFECASTTSNTEMGFTGSLSFSGCSEGCTVQAVGMPYGFGYTSVAGGNATLTIYGDNTYHVVLAVKCQAAECVYTSTPIEASFEGGEPAHIYVAKTLTEEEGGFFCPESMQWEAAYEATAPALPLFVTYRDLEGPVFCKSNLALCPQESIATNIGATLAKTGMTVGTFGGGGTVTCAGGSFSIQDEELEGEGPWRYKPGIFEKCTSAMYTACTAGYLPPPLKLLLFPGVGGDGTTRAVEGFGKQEPTLEVNCTYLGKPRKCLYRTGKIALDFFGGLNALLEEEAGFKRLEGPTTFCSEFVTLTANYLPSYTGGTSLYLTEAEP